MDVFFMYNLYYTLCAQHTSAPPPSPGRETRVGVSVWPHPPSWAVFACHFTGGPVVPEYSLSTPFSRGCRG